jgi:hypothetical protein
MDVIQTDDRLKEIDRKLDLLGMLGVLVAGIFAARFVYYTATDMLNIGEDPAMAAAAVGFFLAAFWWGRRFFGR